MNTLQKKMGTARMLFLSSVLAGSCSQLFAQPATFTVSNLNDSGPGSLRQAISVQTLIIPALDLARLAMGRQLQIIILYFLALREL